jgi:TPR repeat protein
MWELSDENCLTSSGPGKRRFARDWLRAVLAVSATFILSACSSLPPSRPTDEPLASESQPKSTASRSQVEAEAGRDSSISAGVAADVEANADVVVDAEVEADVEALSGSIDDAEKLADDELAIGRAIQLEAEGDIGAAIRAVDPPSEDDSLDARLARGDAVRFGQEESGRISAAAAWYRKVFIDAQASERVRISASFRLHALRMEIHESHPSYLNENPDESGVGMALPIGWKMIQDGLYDEGLQTLLLEAETLSPLAQSALERIYHPGLKTGLPPHDARILEFFRATADDGYWRSIAFLGKVHANGWGVPASLSEGVAMLQEAGEISGSPDPYMDLGSIHYESGDLVQAVEAWKRAGELGSADGWYEVGVSWSDAQGFEWAAKAYQNAIDLNPEHPDALLNLALLYEEGLGVSQSDQRALSLYREAAKYDSAPAAFMVGQYLLFGRAVDTDLEQGRQFLEKSAAGGFAPAGIFLSEWDEASSLPTAWWDR